MIIDSEKKSRDQLKRLMNKLNRVTSTYRHQGKVQDKDMIDLCNAQIKYEESLKDEN